MQYYIELTLLPDEDTSAYFLWSKVYTQLHIAFVEHIDAQEKIPFGVSFPQYRINQQKQTGFLGNKIRIFANTENELQQLNLESWLERLVDYVHIKRLSEVPKDIKSYAYYYRVNPKMDLDTRIAHQARRRNISLSEAKQHFKEYVDQPVTEPYVSLKSLSAKREENIDRFYRLYIGKSFADEAKAGKFGTYGLSRMAAVPEF
ncbi:type I-F CRISPR-associated endoribonuclease Cas6/Csy4 [Acinetobacter sp. S40]|uniref:type I-F CRISPR-associated endoribonuclease Cas6/Csy4 n=1 Tax=unclassified Acinetobacter TaxID=196816 RepID=UPI00190E018C|nr:MULTISPECIES: type I-F CRISPR-associated endoribonuclease Cas6/Csy4 [unclassified Acinetobacter]MBJ9985828.1 type I-F CRISPR-associated endoribonuclease Cas6/Csy4 [Acinetobacter sp. S40]MBK0063609.1 type I-F CRISPR-associated endoribonuclease Cas6/Csy4 [Acinetobacter sp. S55]MBK0067487.1 type I-F CRISPR-associated endoribonuclease Cas6/Csy4 [Acinetobacter sp. S54]